MQAHLMPWLRSERRRVEPGVSTRGWLAGRHGGEKVAVREDVANTILGKMKKTSGWQ